MFVDEYTKDVVRGILHNAVEYEWTLQGFGMLRLYLPNDVRMHVWSHRHVVKDVTLIHTHPWAFKSTVIAGAMYNIRYLRDASLRTHYEQQIRCGEGGGLRGEPNLIGLRELRPEFYHDGDSYEQSSEEIHASYPMTGTVTVIHRTFNDDPDHSYVFWQNGSRFVSAEPRIASDIEVREITQQSLRRWFNRK